MVLALGFGLGLLVWGCGAVPGGPETRPVGPSVLSAAELRASRRSVDFERHVRPILEGRCLGCHNDEERSGDFSLATRFEATKDSRVVPGKADESLMIIFLTTGNPSLTMPAVGSAPPDEEIRILRRWINEGAKWPQGVRLGPAR